MDREIIVHKLSKKEGRLIQEMRDLFALMEGNERLKGKVLEDIILKKTEDGLEIRYLFQGHRTPERVP